MSIYDSRPEKIKLETSEATSVGRIQHFTELTVGGGTECIVLNKEGEKFGARTFADANAYIKTDGTFKFKNVSGTIMDSTDGVQMLKDATVTTAALANLSVDTAKLANLAVEASKLANSSVESTKIANLAVGSAAIAALAVGTGHIANAAITNAKINDLDAGKINAGTISADRIAASSIVAGKLSVSTLSSITANIGSITSGTVTGAILQTASTGYRILMTNSNKLEFKNSGTLYGEIYTYQTSPYGMVLNAASGSEIKLSVGDSTRLVAKTISTNPVIEFYQSGQRIYCDESDKLKFTCNIIPKDNEQQSLGNATHKWLDVYADSIKGDKVYCGNQNANEYITGAAAFIEWGFLTKNQRKGLEGEDGYFNPNEDKDVGTGFKEGEVLIWKRGKLQKCDKEMDKMVQAVATKKGLPVVMGAENVKVLGKVKIGDWIVSSKNGYGKAEKNPEFGTVIAQALENKKDNKKGFILAMIRKI